jgi:hypothetical protein
MTALFVRSRAYFAALVSAAALMVALPAQAQELAPEHVALARQYIDLTDRGAVYEVMLVQVAIETMRTIIQQNPEIIDETDTAITETLTSYRERKGELLDQFARIYAQRFTMDELGEIVAFYSTPTGEKLAQVNAEISTDIQTVMQIFEANLQTEFFAAVRADLRSQGFEI